MLTCVGGLRIAGVNLKAPEGRGCGMTGPPEGIPKGRPAKACGPIGCCPVIGRAEGIERTTGGWPRGGTAERYGAATGNPAPCWFIWAVGRTCKGNKSNAAKLRHDPVIGKHKET